MEKTTNDPPVGSKAEFRVPSYANPTKSVDSGEPGLTIGEKSASKIEGSVNPPNSKAEFRVPSYVSPKSSGGGEGYFDLTMMSNAEMLADKRMTKEQKQEASESASVLMKSIPNALMDGIGSMGQLAQQAKHVYDQNIARPLAKALGDTDEEIDSYQKWIRGQDGWGGYLAGMLTGDAFTESAGYIGGKMKEFDFGGATKVSEEDQRKYWIAAGVGSGIGQIIPMLIGGYAGALAKAPRAASLFNQASIFAAETTGYIEGFEQETGKKIEDNPNQFLAANLYGLIAAKLEQLGVNPAKFGSGSMASGARKGIFEAIEKFAANPNVSAEVVGSTSKAIGEIVWEATKKAGGEGIQEGLQTLAEDVTGRLANKVSENKRREATGGELFENLWHSAAIGSLVGGIVSGSSYISKSNRSKHENVLFDYIHNGADTGTDLNPNASMLEKANAALFESSIEDKQKRIANIVRVINSTDVSEEEKNKAIQAISDLRRISDNIGSGVTGENAMSAFDYLKKHDAISAEIQAINSGRDGSIEDPSIDTKLGQLEAVKNQYAAAVKTIGKGKQAKLDERKFVQDNPAIKDFLEQNIIETGDIAPAENSVSADESNPQAPVFLEHNQAEVLDQEGKPANTNVPIQNMKNALQDDNSQVIAQNENGDYVIFEKNTVPEEYRDEEVMIGKTKVIRKVLVSPEKTEFTPTGFISKDDKLSVEALSDQEIFKPYQSNLSPTPTNKAPAKGETTKKTTQSNAGSQQMSINKSILGKSKAEVEAILPVGSTLYGVRGSDPATSKIVPLKVVGIEESENGARVKVAEFDTKTGKLTSEKTSYIGKAPYYTSEAQARGEMVNNKTEPSQAQQEPQKAEDTSKAVSKEGETEVPEKKEPKPMPEGKVRKGKDLKSFNQIISGPKASEFVKFFGEKLLPFIEFAYNQIPQVSRDYPTGLRLKMSEAASVVDKATRQNIVKYFNMVSSGQNGSSLDTPAFSPSEENAIKYLFQAYEKGKFQFRFGNKGNFNAIQEAENIEGTVTPYKGTVTLTTEHINETISTLTKLIENEYKGVMQTDGNNGLVQIALAYAVFGIDNIRIDTAVASDQAINEGIAKSENLPQDETRGGKKSNIATGVAKSLETGVPESEDTEMIAIKAKYSNILSKFGEGKEMIIRIMAKAMKLSSMPISDFLAMSKQEQQDATDILNFVHEVDRYLITYNYEKARSNSSTNVPGGQNAGDSQQGAENTQESPSTGNPTENIRFANTPAGRKLSEIYDANKSKENVKGTETKTGTTKRQQESGRDETGVTKKSQSPASSSEKAITSASKLNEIWAKLKAKYGEKKAKTFYDAAIRLFNPNSVQVEDIRIAGVVTKQGENYLFHPFLDTDLNSKKWRAGTPTSVNDQFQQTQQEGTPGTANKSPKLNISRDEAENSYAESKLTEEDNLEQEPSIETIESQAESNDEATLNEAVRAIDEKIAQATGILSVPTESLTTDESRFQNRDKLDDQVIKNISENWSDANQDPIHVWTDPKDGKTYVLSGHHRYYGAKMAGRKSVKIIDRTNDFNETQAIKFAKEEANANRSMESPLERAKLLREKIARGESKQEIETFLDREGKNKSYVRAIAFLNPSGKMMQTLSQFTLSGDVQTQKIVEQMAQWIGEARRTIGGITNAHENEMFDFLFNKDLSKRVTNQKDFLEKIRASFTPISPESPLNLARFKQKTDGESAYEEEVAAKKKEVDSRQKQINDLNDRFSNPNSPNYIPTSSPDFESARSLANEKISQLETERKAIQKQLEALYLTKRSFVGANTTGSLFDQVDDQEEVVKPITPKPEAKAPVVEKETENPLTAAQFKALGTGDVVKYDGQNYEVTVKKNGEKSFKEVGQLNGGIDNLSASDKVYLVSKNDQAKEVVSEPKKESTKTTVALTIEEQVKKDINSDFLAEDLSLDKTKISKEAEDISRLMPDIIKSERDASGKLQEVRDALNADPMDQSLIDAEIKAADDYRAALRTLEYNKEKLKQLRAIAPVGRVRNQVTIDNLNRIFAGNKSVLKVIEAATKIQDILSAAIPNIQVFAHENRTSFLSSLPIEGLSDQVSGVFITKSNGEIQIHIDLSSAGIDTVYHEGAHAALYSHFGENDQNYPKFRAAIESILRFSPMKVMDENGNTMLMGKYLRDFVSSYEGQPVQLQAEEYLSQLSAVLSMSKGKLSDNVSYKIIEFINNLVSKITNGLIVPFKTTVSAVKMIEGIAESFKNGRIKDSVSTQNGVVTTKTTVKSSLNPKYRTDKGSGPSVSTFASPSLFEAQMTDPQFVHSESSVREIAALYAKNDKRFLNKNIVDALVQIYSKLNLLNSAMSINEVRQYVPAITVDEKNSIDTILNKFEDRSEYLKALKRDHIITPDGRVIKEDTWVPKMAKETLKYPARFLTKSLMSLATAVEWAGIKGSGFYDFFTDGYTKLREQSSTYTNMLTKKQEAIIAEALRIAETSGKGVIMTGRTSDNSLEYDNLRKVRINASTKNGQKDIDITIGEAISMILTHDYLESAGLDSFLTREKIDQNLAESSQEGVHVNNKTFSGLITLDKAEVDKMRSVISPYSRLVSLIKDYYHGPESMAMYKKINDNALNYGASIISTLNGFMPIDVRRETTGSESLQASMVQKFENVGFSFNYNTAKQINSADIGLVLNSLIMQAKVGLINVPVQETLRFYFDKMWESNSGATSPSAYTLRPEYAAYSGLADWIKDRITYGYLLSPEMSKAESFFSSARAASIFSLRALGGFLQHTGILKGYASTVIKSKHMRLELGLYRKTFLSKEAISRIKAGLTRQIGTNIAAWTKEDWAKYMSPEVSDIIREVESYSPVLYDRFLNNMILMQDSLNKSKNYIPDVDISLSKSNESLVGHAAKKLGKVADKIKEKWIDKNLAYLMSGIYWGDAIAVVGIIKAAKRQAAEEGKGIKEAYSLALAATEETQVMDDDAYKSNLTLKSRASTGDSFVLRALIAFQQESQTAVNMNAQAHFRYLKNKDSYNGDSAKKAYAKTLTATALSATGSYAMVQLVRGALLKTPCKEARIYRDAATSTVSGVTAINPVGPYVTPFLTVATRAAAGSVSGQNLNGLPTDISGELGGVWNPVLKESEIMINRFAGKSVPIKDDISNIIPALGVPGDLARLLLNCITNKFTPTTNELVP